MPPSPRVTRTVLALAFVAAACGDDGGGSPSDGAGLDGRADAAAVDGPAADAPADAPPADAAGNGETTAVTTRLGEPIFEIVDWQVFSAPLGAPGDRGPAIATLEAVWTDHAWDAGAGGIGPDVGHLPPYDGELSAGLAAAGIDPGNRFALADWTAPQGIFIAATLVPGAGAPSGGSADFATGAIIPAAILPLTIEGELFEKGGLVTDASFATAVVPTAEEGFSHIPLAWGENTAAIAGTPGFYHLEVEITDNGGNGWLADLAFRIDG